MGQILFSDKVGALSYSSPNVTMTASISSPAYLTIGGQQYTVTSSLSVNTGTLTAQNLYYIYAVQTAGVVSLQISTNVNSIGPAGFNSWKLIGAFYTNTSAVFSAFVSNKSVTPSTIVTLTVSVANTTATGTYITPPQTSALRVRMVAGGASGSGSGTGSIGNGAAGSTTLFGPLTANGGAVTASPTPGGGNGGVGGTGSIGAGWTGEVRQGGQGQTYSFSQTNAIHPVGGAGGSNPLGEGAPGIGYNSNGHSAISGSGGGGGGAGGNEITNLYSGIGGGSGGYVEAETTSAPLSSYSWQVGQGGVAGSNQGISGNAGGNGGDGRIIIEEIKPNLEQLKDL